MMMFTMMAKRVKGDGCEVEKEDGKLQSGKQGIVTAIQERATRVDDEKVMICQQVWNNVCF